MQLIPVLLQPISTITGEPAPLRMQGNVSLNTLSLVRTVRQGSFLAKKIIRKQGRFPGSRLALCNVPVKLGIWYFRIKSQNDSVIPDKYFQILVQLLKVNRH